jgi:hypothetical protein
VNKSYIVFALAFCFIISAEMSGQSFWFGVKGGPALSFQRWDGFEPNPLLVVNGDFTIESYKEDSPSSLYAQLGYHTRGSSLRVFTWQGQLVGNQGFKFRNVVLEVGAKRMVDLDSKFKPYYAIGLRGEYTLNTNLSDYDRFESLFYPNDGFVQKFLWGPSLNGGFEWEYEELVTPYLEFSIQPDVSDQYFQPPVNNVIDQFGQPRNLRERIIRNITLELKVGIKFLRKVIYTD